MDDDAAQAETFLTTVESVTGQEVPDEHFPSGTGDTAVVIGPADEADGALRADLALIIPVVLGVERSIFLMTRVREEALVRGTRPGVLVALASTGGVITSAGVVLAATFAAQGVVPLIFLAQLAFLVSFGVLLDTLVVRSLLLPGLAHDLGRRTWWPSRLGRTDPARA